MVYGLGRVDAIRQAGVFRRVLVPDRLLLMELSLEGSFGRLPEDSLVSTPVWIHLQPAAATPGVLSERPAVPTHTCPGGSVTRRRSPGCSVSVENGRRPSAAGPGFRLGERYLRLAGLLHLRQELKQFRIDLFERAAFLKPIYLRARRYYRGFKRRSGLERLAGQWCKRFGDTERRQHLLQRGDTPGPQDGGGGSSTRQDGCSSARRGRFP